MRCEQTFKQALWLWKGIWPEVNGMGESDDFGAAAGGATPANASNAQNDPIEIQDDEAAERSVGPEGPEGEVAQTPFGGSGLGAVHAANQSG